MDVPTLVVSAIISAVVSAAVAVAVIGYRTSREARALRRVRAREGVEREARQLRRDLRAYEAGLDRGLHRDEPTTAVGEDYVKASAVLAHVDDLPPWRAALVRRRCRIIFGDLYVSLAEARTTDPSAPGSLMTPLFTADWWAAEQGKPREPTQALLHRAYCEQPGHPELAKLDRNLARLTRGV